MGLDYQQCQGIRLVCVSLVRERGGDPGDSCSVVLSFFPHLVLCPLPFLSLSSSLSSFSSSPFHIPSCSFHVLFLLLILVHVLLFPLLLLLLLLNISFPGHTTSLSSPLYPSPKITRGAAGSTHTHPNTPQPQGETRDLGLSRGSCKPVKERKKS